VCCNTDICFGQRSLYRNLWEGAFLRSKILSSERGKVAAFVRSALSGNTMPFPLASLLMLLQSKEIKVRRDPARRFENDFAWIKVRGVRKLTSWGEAIVELGVT
jgi:hypothetical protein